MVGLTIEQRQQRERNDQRQIAEYANAMMQKEFPSLGFPREGWVFNQTSQNIIYTAGWDNGAVVRIIGRFDSWNIAASSGISNPESRYIAETDQWMRQEKDLCLLAVICVAREWCKDFV